MKLRNLVLAAALSLPLLAVADDASTNPFAGMFAGLGLGYTNTDGKATTASNVDSVDFGKGGFAGQLLAGYNYGIDANWLVGVDAFFGANATKADDHYTTYSVSSKMNQVYGLDAILGYALNQTAMFYGGFGWASSKLKLDATSGSETVNNNIDFNGWRAVVGAQQVLTDAVSIRESVDYTGYKSKDWNALTESGTIKPSQVTSMFSLIYTFNI